MRAPRLPRRGTRRAPRLARPPLWAAVSLLCLACGSDDPSRPDAAVLNDLVFTRAGGTPVEFSPRSELYVWCDAWDDPEVPTPSLQIVFASASAGDPFWQLKAVLADVRLGESLFFPNVFTWNQPREVELFVLDPPNELSTATAASSGSIVFQQLDCEGVRLVEFSLDAQIGSEFGGGQPLSVRGTLRAPIGSFPPFDAAGHAPRRARKATW